MAEHARAILAKPENAGVLRLGIMLKRLERAEAAKDELQRRDDPTLPNPATGTPRARALYKRLIFDRAAARLARDYPHMLRAA